MIASASAARTISAPGSEFITAMSAEASRTTLVTLDLGAAVLKDFLREQHTLRSKFGKMRLYLGHQLILRFDMHSGVIFDDDHRIAAGNVEALTGICRKDDAPGGIHLKVVDLMIA